ncbi:MAG TPA: isopentenyl-diphosphate delta-isomerase [Lachnospiraceae bacterium]|nr:isopentenyl-diphosphate delta-isomerase [Lachnospiraceae bacterium]
MKQKNDLLMQLNRIHRKSYPAYKDLQGQYSFGEYILSIDHVQGDPFAAPSRLSIYVPHRIADFPSGFYENDHRRTALADFLLRAFGAELAKHTFQAKGSGKSGILTTSCPGQEILSRTACEITSGQIILRMEAGFPANGRTINAPELEKMLCHFLPDCTRHALFYKNLDRKKLQQWIDLSDDQTYLRAELTRRNLSAFIADGAILPRESGVSERPMRGSIPFSAPETLRESIDLPHLGRLTGMGIHRGITLIVGGGYHGKSTLLNALEMGVYNHIPGDGREYVVSDPSAFKLRAEDGRSIFRTDISLFINDLPNKKDTHAFTTEDASGSTSQAANLIEAAESGSTLLLIDEDTSATNFMVRDDLMQKVIRREQEPITPFLERARDLFEQDGISTILVAGSSGAYFHIADTILQMDHYRPYDITEQVQQILPGYPIPSIHAPNYHLPDFRRILPRMHQGSDFQKVKTYGKDSFQIGKSMVELRCLEQLTDAEQTNALAHLVRYAQSHYMDGKRTLKEIVDLLERELSANGFAHICESRSIPGGLALPRRQEIFCCFNRLRGLH